MSGEKKNIKTIVLTALICLFFWLVAVGLYQTNKSLPGKLNYLGKEYLVNDSNIEFLYDLTYLNSNGEKQYKQNIFNTLLDAIDGAEQYILIDMFLFNSYTAKNGTFHKNLSKELTKRLLQKKKTLPAIVIDFITDPINTTYGGSISPELEQIENAGINVIITDLQKMRDSNFIYSSLWRTFIQWFGNSDRNGILKHPFSSTEDNVSLRSYLRLANFKANHRKIFVADSSKGMITIVSSANPHGGSSQHSNIALLVRGDIWRSVYEAEQSVAMMSGGSLSQVEFPSESIENRINARIRVLSENQIKIAIIREISSENVSQKIKIAQFYMADRDIIKALLTASDNDVDIKIILDPNKDAFGYEKNGIPNRQVAHELVKKSQNRIQIRWYDTHGEQFHSKLFVSERVDRVTAILGSANLTRRNLDNYNLELDVLVTMEKNSETAKIINRYFNRIWNNENGLYTVDFEKYEEDSLVKNIIYRIQEGMGLATF